MADTHQEKVELEIREYTDADFFPEHCPSCGHTDIVRKTYKMRTLQDLGTPFLCRRIRYEKVWFVCKKCDTVFTIQHPLVPPRSKYMPGVVKYATERVLKKGDSLRRVAEDLNELHKVEVSHTKVKTWVDKAGGRGELKTDFSDEEPPADFSGFISVDATFKAAKTKKNSRKPGKTDKSAKRPS